MDGDNRFDCLKIVANSRCFIAIMQVLALEVLLEHHSLSSKVVIDLAISLPALLAGTLLGILAFRNINEVGFRRTILVVLSLSGASLAFA
jgi:uncharacterized membrane protein YfcA